MTTSDFTRDEIETGRKLFSGDWQFFAASSSPESLPKMRATEIAFAGRSNVGKSSLINALTSRKALARTSRTPGRTQELIFFSAGGPLTLVDMPGYGYAAAAKSKIAAWTDLIEQFLHGPGEPCARLCAGRCPPRAERHRRRHLQGARPRRRQLSGGADQGRHHQAIRTGNAHQGNRGRDGEVAVGFPTVLATSGHEGTGLQDVRAAVARLLAERKA